MIYPAPGFWFMMGFWAGMLIGTVIQGYVCFAILRNQKKDT